MSEREKIVEEEQELNFPEDYYHYDSEDYKSVLRGFPNQVNMAYKHQFDVKFEGEINKVVISGMGGSAIAGGMLQSFLRNIKVPIIINRNYDLPAHVDKKTLVIAISYSGNTEETVSAYKDALRKNCQIVLITTGGKLAHMAITNRTQIIKIPRGMQPRAAIAYMFFPVLKLLEQLEITGGHKKEVDSLVKALDNKIFEQTGINISEKLVGKIPIIYSGEAFEPVTYIWKINLNETAKVFAINNVFPELNHNEVESIKNQGAKVHGIFLRTDLDSHRIVKRMDLTRKYYRKVGGIDVTEIAIKGDTLLTKMFTAMYMGSWVAYYLALRYETDPNIYVMVEEFKKDLGTFIQ